MKKKKTLKKRNSTKKEEAINLLKDEGDIDFWLVMKPNCK